MEPDYVLCCLNPDAKPKLIRVSHTKNDDPFGKRGHFDFVNREIYNAVVAMLREELVDQLISSDPEFKEYGDVRRGEFQSLYNRLFAKHEIKVDDWIKKEIEQWEAER